MLIDRANWHHHRPWVLATVAAFLAATGWYFVSCIGVSPWPGGSSLPGFTFGVIGGLIILFEILLWWRKKVRVWRIGRAQAWLRAHIWLGLLCLPLLIYHSGFRWGGTLSTVLLVLLIVVIASGVWGLALQQFLPSRMLDEVPAETIYSQIDRVVGQLYDEANQLVLSVCGPAEDEPAAAPDHQAGAGTAEAHLVVGAVRSAGRVQGKVLETRSAVAQVPGSEPLRLFFRGNLGPFLRAGAGSGSALQFPNRAAVMFHDLRTKLEPAAHAAVDTLENLCDQRRQLDTQARIQFWLHSWLWIHLPLSVALVVLMIVHIWVALKYW